MPNRYIRESAIESEAVNALSWKGEVFYRRLLNRADDFGRFTANLALLRASLFPLQLEKVSEKDIAELLKECEGIGLIATYDADGKRFLALAKWEQGRAKESRYPHPPEDVCKRLQTYVYRRKQKSADVPDSDSDSDNDPDTETPAADPWLLDHGLSIPESLRTQNCMEALKLWLAYKKEKREPYKRIGLQAMLTKLASEYTPADLPKAIEASIAAGWKGIYQGLNFGKPIQKESSGELLRKIQANRGWPNHPDYANATEEEKALHATLSAKYKAAQ